MLLLDKMAMVERWYFGVILTILIPQLLFQVISILMVELMEEMVGWSKHRVES